MTEIFVGENAVVDHIKLQEESPKAFHIGRMEVDQERSSNFSSHLISTGAEFSRNEFTTRFNGEGGESMLNGLFMIKDEQFFDAHTMIDHAMRIVIVTSIIKEYFRTKPEVYSMVK